MQWQQIRDYKGRSEGVLNLSIVPCTAKGAAVKPITDPSMYSMEFIQLSSSEQCNTV